MSLEPNKIYLHDPLDTFNDDSLNPFESVTWSDERIDEGDYEYIRSSQNVDVVDVKEDIQALLQVIDDFYEIFTVQELESFSKEKLDAGVKLVRLKNKVSEYFN